MKRTLAAVPMVVLLVLAACSSQTAAAEAVYDACSDSDVETNVLERDGRDVIISVTGEDARALWAFNAGTGLDDIDTDGLAIGLTMILAHRCIVDETGFPGTEDQLRDGDEWEGWSYSDESGAGSTVRMVFTATG